MLDTQSVAILGDSLTPRRRADVEDALDDLILAALKKWMYTTAGLAGSEQLFDGLRLAGVKD